MKVVAKPVDGEEDFKPVIKQAEPPKPKSGAETIRLALDRTIESSKSAFELRHYRETEAAKRR
jgi:hypothetical protein